MKKRAESGLAFGAASVGSLAFSPIWPSLLIMSPDDETHELISEIRSLEKQVLQSLENVNSLAQLLKHLRVRSDPQF